MEWLQVCLHVIIVLQINEISHLMMNHAKSEYHIL